MERREEAPERGEARSEKERGADLCKHDGLTYSEFLAAAKTAMPDFKIANLNSGKYSHEQMDQIEAQADVARKTKMRRPSAPEARPSGATSAPVAENRSETPATPEATKTDSSEKSRRFGKAATAVGGLALAGVVGAGIFAGVNNASNNAKNVGEANAATASGDSQEQENSQVSEAAEAHEAGEVLDITDNYRGRYADDTGNYTNPNKIGRNGQEAPYNFGEAYEFTTEEAFRQEIQEIAKHEPAMFAAWYYDLDDSVKVPGTEKMSMAELQNLMNENDDMHRRMVEQFISISDSAKFNEDTITGDYTNVFARTTGGDGIQITSVNTEPVHCATHENGSKVVVMSYSASKDKTASIIFREACGLQNVRMVGTPESERIITSTPEIPTPEPDKPSGDHETPPKTPETPPKSPETPPETPPDTPETPPETPPDTPETPPETPPETQKEKTPFDENEVFRDDDAGDTWEADPGAITEDTVTEEPDIPAQEDFYEDTGNYEEPAPVNEDAQNAVQDTSNQVSPEVQAANEEAAEQQQAANEAGHEANQANDEREVRSAAEIENDLADYANDDGTINPEDIPY